MRKILLSATAVLLTATCSYADIQAPPGAEYTSSRKLSRAVTNILYGVVEIPEQMVRKNQQFGSKAAFSYGIVDGTSRAFRRVGYGFYELITFRCPTFHGTFKQPYMRCGQDNRIEMNVSQGLSEFPPELGAESYYNHTRSQSF